MSENQTNSPVQAEPEQDINILKKDRLDKLASLREGGFDPYQITKFDVNAKAADLKAQYEAQEAKIIAEANGDEEKVNAELEALQVNTVRIAGRIMSWRDMGKANFIDLRDASDRIQVYIRSNDVGADLFKEFKKKWDIGDIIGVEGFVFRTRKGEISVHAKKISLLSKSLLPLPEKWH
ncbi:MAG TPA: OB-fold nucleic acid binding domain-containing protein, partial [Ruminococcus sp.]|nr:OB-fold nucleic acid binding domain-containing protein [Ruminococcus sp.]